MNKRYNLHLISKNRDILYGAAMLLIAYFHATFILYGTEMLPLRILKGISDIGLEIFVLASGYSIYFALSKKPKLGDFYRRRLKRILIPYAIAATPYFFYLDIVREGSWTEFILDMLGLNLFITGDRISWFITAIVLFYLVVPHIYCLLERHDWSFGCFAALIAAVLALCLILRLLCPTVWENSEILFRRIPLFIIGLYLGKPIKERREPGLKYWQIFIITFVLLAVALASKKAELSIISWRYVYMAASVFLAMTLSILGENKIISKICRPFAPYTLEFYLTHQRVLYILELETGLERYISINIIGFAAALLLSVLLKKLVAEINP